jgi:hypothetical protein
MTAPVCTLHLAMTHGQWPCDYNVPNYFRPVGRVKALIDLTNFQLGILNFQEFFLNSEYLIWFDFNFNFSLQ